VAGRGFEGLGLVVGKSLTALLAFGTTLAVELILYRRGSIGTALLALGLGRPDGRVLATAIVVSGVLLASMPLVFSLTGAAFALPDNWLLLALGIFALNGVAEETLYRGYLFGHLREGRSFRRALLIGTLLAAVAHLPILVTTGVVVGLTSILVSVLTFAPFAVLYERGKRTIWAPAVVHAAVDFIIPLGALGLALPLTSLAWLGVSVAACYVAMLLAERLGGRAEASQFEQERLPAH
jgi:membrane protease YdiL (CAAX protease family)